MFRFFRSGHLEPDQDQEQQQRQPLLQSDQIPYQSSYDSISEHEVVNSLMVDSNRFDYFFFSLSKHKRHVYCTPLNQPSFITFFP